MEPREQEEEDVVKDGVESQVEGKGNSSEASSTSKPGSGEVSKGIST